MYTGGKGESSVSEDGECRSKGSQEVNSDSLFSLNVDPFQRLIRHFSSLNNHSVTVDKKRKCFSSHYENPLIVSFQDERSFNDALATAKICLEKDECSKETACSFYSLIKSIADHVSYMKEQNDNIEKVYRTKLDWMDFTQKTLLVCDKIKTILILSYQEKVWNYLTQSQKKDIENFQKLFDKFYEQLNEDCAIYGDKNAPANSTTSNNQSKKACCMSLKSKQHQELLCENDKLLAELTAMKEKCTKLKETNSDINVASPHCQNQARLIATLSPFLYVHRLDGQSIPEILSYLKSLGYCIHEQEIENILQSYPTLFKECQSSEGHTEEKKWIFCGFDL